MTKTKHKTLKIIIGIVAALIILAGAALAVLRFGFGIDIFDRSGWNETADGKPCYLDYYGDPLTGWQVIEGTTYYFDPANGGAMVTGWLDLGGNRYYLDASGILTIGWAELEGGRYCFDPSGVMQTGWVDTADGRYYLSESGVMHTGWLEMETGRYFFDESGTMHLGWLDAGDDRYYLQDDGTMAVGEMVVDGIARHFTSAGKYLVLVNPWNELPEDFVLDLVEYEGYEIDRDTLEPLKTLMAACEEAGYPCRINSAYRSYQTQQDLWDERVASYMEQGYSYEEADRLTGTAVAVPGTSEHHLGYAVDLGCSWNGYLWLEEHCWDYGFILRYPADKTEQTGIIYEPWHFRYVGMELAQEMKGTGLCLEEYMDMLTQSEAFELDIAA